MKLGRGVAFALAAAGAGAFGCTAILGLDEPSPYSPSATDFPNPYPGVVAEASAGGGTQVCAADLMADPKNCGRCGRDCGGAQRCTDGRCEPAQLASDLTAAPVRLVIGRGRGFFSTAPQFVYRTLSPTYNYCYQFGIYAFPLTGRAPLQHVASPCARPETRWGTDGDHVFGWLSYLNVGGGAQGTLLRFGPDPLPDGGEADSGTPVIANAAIRDFLLADPGKPSGMLVGPNAGATGGVISSLGPDGGLDTVLALTTPPGVPPPETLADLAPTADSFAVLSRNTTTGDQRIWTAPRTCDASTCTASLSSNYASVCGIRRFGDAIRWCGLEPDPSGTAFLLLLLEANATTQVIRVVNTSPVVPRGTNGTPVLPLLLLDEPGIYFARGVRIDLLPMAGPTVPIALATTKPLALASDDTQLYWAEVDAIYGVTR